MIYEIRTYEVKPRTVPEVEKRFGEAYKQPGEKAPLVGSFHTEIGQLNEIVHIWAFADLDERDRVQRELRENANWPPKLEEFIVHAESEIVRPFPFLPDFEPGDHGPIYELREYNFILGKPASISETWEKSLPERIKRSPLLMGGYVQFGNVNKFVHLWPYKSMDERLAVRNKAVADGIWPPTSSESPYFAQRNRILLPSAFSPSR